MQPMNHFLNQYFEYGGGGRKQQSQPYWDVSNIEVFHVMRALHVVVDRTSSCAAKCLDGVSFTFLKGNSNNKDKDA